MHSFPLEMVLMWQLWPVLVFIQPGGSIRDDEVSAAANEHNIAMILPTCVIFAINKGLRRKFNYW